MRRSTRRAGIVKRSISISGHATSVSLEEPFWEALKEMAALRRQPLAALVCEIDAARGEANLSSALRLAVLAHARAGAGEPARKP
jgi:predicted DNA-binding ribbon-helix-helix protein